MLRILCAHVTLSAVLLLGVRAAAEDAKKTAPTQEQIAGWVRDLGADEFDKRESASKQLWEAGRAAQPAVQKAVDTDDQEVRLRSRAIAEKFKWGLFPDTPAQVAELIERYRNGGDGDAKALVYRDALEAGAEGRAAIASITAAEDKTALATLHEKTAALFVVRAAESFGKNEYGKMIKDCDEAIKLNAKNAEAFRLRAAARHNQRDTDNAIKDWTEAIRLSPEDLRSYYGRGHTWLVLKQVDKALKDLDDVVRLEPRWSEGFVLRGACYSQKKNYEHALKDYDEALRLNARSSAALNAKAWLLASCPEAKYRDGKAALALATQVCELTEWKNVFYYDVLGVAHAEVGEFDKAVEWLEKALKDKEYERDYGDQTRKRVELFKAKKPFREE